MSIALTKFPKVQYSVMERYLFEVMPKDGRRFTSAHIAKKRDEHSNWNVVHPLNIITMTMSRLIEKVQTNNENFKIMKDGKRPDHHMVEFWVESLEKPAKKKRKLEFKKRRKTK